MLSVDSTSLTVNFPDVSFDGVRTVTVRVVLVDDVWMSVDGSVTVAGLHQTVGAV